MLKAAITTTAHIETEELYTTSEIVEQLMKSIDFAKAVSSSMDGFSLSITIVKKPDLKRYARAEITWS